MVAAGTWLAGLILRRAQLLVELQCNARSFVRLRGKLLQRVQAVEVRFQTWALAQQLRAVGLAALVHFVKILLQQVEGLLVELLKLLGGSGLGSAGGDWASGAWAGRRGFNAGLFGVRIHGRNPFSKEGRPAVGRQLDCPADASMVQCERGLKQSSGEKRRPMQPTIRSLVPASALLAATLATCWFVHPAPAYGQGPLLTPQQAGRESYWYFESQRQANVQRQLGWIDTTRWLNGLPNRYTGLRNSPSLAAIYSGATTGLVPGGYVFEPWPYVPGDIYGFQWDDLGSQPIGNDVVFAGPNRYSYRAVYDADAPAASPNAPPAEPAAALPFDPDAATIAAREPRVAVPPPPAAGEPAPGPLAGDVRQMLAAAKQALAAGNPEAALQALDAVAADAAQRPWADLLRSHALFAVGRFDEAAAALRPALAALPWEQQRRVLQGFERDYPSAQAYTARLRQLEQAIAAAPREVELRLLLGYHYGYLGFLPEAVTELSQVLQLQPDDPEAAQLQRQWLQRLDQQQAPAVPPAVVPPAVPANRDQPRDQQQPQPQQPKPRQAEAGRRSF